MNLQVLILSQNSLKIIIVVSEPIKKVQLHQAN